MFKSSSVGSVRMKEEVQDGVDDHVVWWRSCRFALAIVGFLGFFNLYTLRVNMSVAMVCMVNQTALRGSGADHVTATVAPSNDSGGVCYAQVASSFSDGEFAWEKQLQGIILSSFFWGYLLTQIPGGWLSQTYSARRVFGYCMLMASIATILTPLGSRGSPYLLIVLRIIIGLGEGVVFPAMHCLWSKWAPLLERSKLIGFTYAGAQIGTVVAMPISGVLCKSGLDGGWPGIFYFFGGIGVLWFILWMVVTSDTPSSHPRISSFERKYIEESLHTTHVVTKKTPWCQIFRSRPVWAIIIGHTCSNWGTYTLLTNMPTYMREVLQFDIKSNGLFSAIPFVVFWGCINIAGIWADAMLACGWCTKLVRRVSQVFGNILPAVFLVATGHVSCAHPYIAIGLLSLSVGFSGFQYSGVMVNHMDVAPSYAGILFGISNTAATLSGIAAPYLIGVITTDQTQAQWQIVFYVAAVVYTFGCIVFMTCMDDVIQPWAKSETESGDVMVPLSEKSAVIQNGLSAIETVNNGASH